MKMRMRMRSEGPPSINDMTPQRNQVSIKRRNAKLRRRKPNHCDSYQQTSKSNRTLVREDFQRHMTLFIIFVSRMKIRAIRLSIVQQQQQQQ